MTAAVNRWTIVFAGLWACASSSRHQTDLIPMPDNPAPAYPQILRASGLTGTVVVELLVDRTGAVVPESMTVISESHPAFTAEVRRVIPLWRFQRKSGDSTEAVVEQRFDFKTRRQTAAECRALLLREDSLAVARTGRALGDSAQELRVLHSRLPSRGGTAKTVAEFVVDTAGRPDLATLRIVQSSLSDREARADLARVLSDWRFAPASRGACVYAARTRYEFVY
jgi:TonB family protein